MVDSTGAIGCRHESNVDIPGGIHHTAGLHQLPSLHLHQPEIPTSGEIATKHCTVEMLAGENLVNRSFISLIISFVSITVAPSNLNIILFVVSTVTFISFKEITLKSHEVHSGI